MLPGQKSITNALPIDICRFLVFKDAKGKTQPHRNGCLHVGKKGLFDCRCPCRLAYSTVDSYIGKLRSIFAEAGRQGEWNRTLLLGNPATDLLVKIYLKQVTAKQLQARVTPKQAVPIFPDKLLLISNYLKKRLAMPNLSASEQFITAGDQAFFKTLFYSVDRAGDLGQVKFAEIARFLDDSGFLFNHIWGKTVRDGASNLFGLRRHPNSTLCPVRVIEEFVACARKLGIGLAQGYLFRPTDSKGHVIDKPLSSAAAEHRLKLYLKEARIDAGETLHSFRSGCALTLAFSGSALADLMTHVGWSSPATAEYYPKLANVIKAVAPADPLAQDSPSVTEVADPYSRYDSLKDFIAAFPSQASSSQKHSFSQ